MSEEKKPEQCPICGDDLMLDRQQLKALNDRLVDLSERYRAYADAHPECPVSVRIIGEALKLKDELGGTLDVVFVWQMQKWCLVPRSETERKEHKAQMDQIYQEIVQEEQAERPVSPLALPRQPRVWRPSRAMRAQEDDLA